MLRQVLDDLRPLLRRPRLDPLRIAVVSAIAGVAEASVLVLVVNVSVAIADGTSDEAIELPVFGIEASTSALLTTAALLAVTVAVMNATIAWLSARLGADVLHESRRRLIGAFLRASWTRQSAEREGAVQEAATTYATNTATLATSLTIGLAAGIALTGLLGSAFVVDPVVTIVVLAVGLTLSVVFRPIVRLTRRRASRFVSENSTFAEEVARVAASSMESRVFGIDEMVRSDVEATSERVSRRSRDAEFAVKAGLTFYRDAAVLALVGAVAVLAGSGGDRLVEIGAVSLLVLRSLGYATNVQYTLQNLSQLSPNLAALRERIDDLEANAAPPGDRAIERFERIELEDVQYSYGEGIDALRAVDLVIERGDIIGVVGASGSGKSTLVQLLLRLRRPTTGRITVDGLDQAEIDERSWSRLVALVPQEPQLISASVAANIAFLRPGIERDEIEAAARAAQVADDIVALPDGFETVLGPRGSGLSGGQKQRVAFARALVGHPALLVLDEPTSALDAESEARLQRTIEALRGDVTMVIVAHRPTTLSVCNRIVTLEHGTITSDRRTDER